METTRIFIASSSELENDRREFREFLSVENDRLHKMGHYLELIQWEHFLDSVSHNSKQADYNGELLKCDMLVCLFHTKAGKYTLEEFETGLKQFRDSGKPLIYTYFKEPAPPYDERDENSLSLKKFKDRLTEIGHFYTRYESTDSLKLHFLQQLNFLAEKGLAGLKEKELSEARPFITQYFNSKNANYGRFTAEKVQFGDTYIQHENGREMPKSLTQKIPTTNPGNIIGRESELTDLQELLFSERQVVLVNGIGGIGKTTLAQAYVHKHWLEYKHIAWIEQSGENIQLDFANDPTLLKNLEITMEVGDTDAIFGEVLRMMKSIPVEPNLLIMDNATASLEALVHSLPKAPKWHILVTSREELDGLLPKKLDFLSPESAFQLFKKHYSRKQLKDDEIKTLIKSVDYHTLTVEILAKTAMLQRYSFDKLQAALKDDARANIKTGRSGAEKVEQITSYLCSIFQISELSATEKWLLQQFCLLPPEYHEFEILHKLIAQEDHEHYDRFAETAETLAKKGWLISDSDEDAFKMHRIIQEVVLSKSPPIFSEALPFVDKIDALLSIDQTKDNPTEKFQWIPFGQWILDILNTERYPEFADHPSRIELLDHLGWVYKESGEYGKSKALRELALSISLQINGEEDSITSRLRSNLALVLKALGDYKGAKELLQKATISDEKNFGPEHPTTAVSYSNLALVLKDLGDYKGAKELLQKATISDENNFGPDHPNTARSYSNLALVLQALGDYKGAKELLQKATISDENNFGPDHPNTAVSYSNLALVLKALGDYKGAKELLQKATISAENNFGPEHPNTARRYSNLALVLKALGDYKGAKELLQKATISAENSFGPEHPTTAVRYSNLATVLKDLGDYKGAKELLQKATISDENNFGPEHPTTAVRYSNLALVLKDLGDYKGAKELLQKATISAENNFGPEHPNTARRYSNLALVLKDLGDYKGAKELLQKATISDENNFGPDHPNTARSYSNLATVLQDLGDFERAISLAEKAVSIFTLSLPEEHPYIEQSISILEGIRKQAGK